MEIKKGNKEDLITTLKDSDNQLIDLSIISNIKFVVKEEEFSDTDVFTKTKANGDIVISDNEKSEITIKIKSIDTDQTPKTYRMGLRLYWTDGNSTEIDLLNDQGQPDNIFKIIPSITSHN